MIDDGSPDAGVSSTGDRGEAPAGVPFDVAACLAGLIEETAAAIRRLRRRGAVVAVSGGVDSGVVAGICVRAVGPEHVLCLRLPERDIGDSSSELGLELARALGARTEEEPITAALEGLGFYRRRDEAIRRVFPDYESGWRHKLVRSPPTGGIIVFSLVVERPDGSEEARRMPPEAYQELISATNMKQRVRKVIEYTWADRLGYAVIGTPNLLEYDQGFFVKGGDGLADVKPIARLYKSQVYLLARELGLPEAIATPRPHNRDFQHAADPGGVLLRPPVRAHGPVDVGARARDRAGRALGSGRSRAKRRGDRLPGDRASTSRDGVPARSADHRRARRLSMCGIAGIVRPQASRPVDEQALLRMVGAIRHRGPDGFGLALDAGAGLVSARLAIFDLPRGWQPYEAGPEGSILVYNGEVYNHPELRAGLVGRGENFTTTCDTEVVLRLLEREGVSSLDRLNGQFAFAWWQPARRRLTLVRDRFGVRPLHYALLDDGSLVFGSEAKALFASGEVSRGTRLRGHRRSIHALGAACPADSIPRASHQVQPGGLIVWERGRIIEERRWWRPEYHLGEDAPGRSRRAAARQRSVAVACGRAGRHLPLRGARFEPDNRLGAGGDRPSAAHLLDCFQGPAL